MKDKQKILQKIAEKKFRRKIVFTRKRSRVGTFTGEYHKKTQKGCKHGSGQSIKSGQRYVIPASTKKSKPPKLTKVPGKRNLWQSVKQIFRRTSGGK